MVVGLVTVEVGHPVAVSAEVDECEVACLGVSSQAEELVDELVHRQAVLLQAHVTEAASLQEVGHADGILCGTRQRRQT